MTPDFDRQQLIERVTAERSQVHSEAGDIWARHAGGVPHDHNADARMRAELQREARGEYDPATGEYRTCRWTETA